MRNVLNANHFIIYAVATILSLAWIISCTNDNVNARLDETLDVGCQEADSIIGDFAVCDWEKIANYPGTACGVSGPVVASPGETLTYEYRSNIPNAIITWDVVGGSITLTNGQNTSIAEFTFGDDFVSGCIRGSSEAVDICSEAFMISKR